MEWLPRSKAKTRYGKFVIWTMKLIGIKVEIIPDKELQLPKREPLTKEDKIIRKLTRNVRYKRSIKLTLINFFVKLYSGEDYCPAFYLHKPNKIYLDATLSNNAEVRSFLLHERIHQQDPYRRELYEIESNKSLNKKEKQKKIKQYKLKLSKVTKQAEEDFIQLIKKKRQKQTPEQEFQEFKKELEYSHSPRDITGEIIAELGRRYPKELITPTTKTGKELKKWLKSH